MCWNRVATAIIDSFAVLTALVLAVPFALMLSAPFLGGL